MSSTALVPSTVTTTTAGRTNSSPLSSSTNALLPKLSTPTKSASSPAKPSTPKPLGQHGWIHPRMDEVIRRRNKTNFDSSNVKAILISSAFILGSLFVPNLLHQILPTSWFHAVQPWSTYALWLIRLVFALSIALGVSPLLRVPDNCEDVPLTPSQRKLLGLPPMSRPATPQEKEQYVTPPRFSRSNTPRSSSSSVRVEASGSPLSGRGTPLDSSSFRLSESQNRGSQSPLGFSGFRSPSERRRLSYPSNRSSPLSVSEFESIGNTATPTKGNRTSVGLNNKWLYEKGKGSPKGLFASRGPSFI